MTKGRASIQRNLAINLRTEEINITKFNTAKPKTVCSGKNNPRHLQRLKTKWANNSPAEKALRLQWMSD